MNRLLSGLRRVSKTELSGPCPFGMGGDDRFSVWEDKGNCFCRWDCPSCPMERNTSSYGGRAGWLNKLGLEISGHVTEWIGSGRTQYATSEDLLRLADEYYQYLDVDGIEYLASRGIDATQIRRFYIGQYGDRVMLPNIFYRRGERICSGIKGRSFRGTGKSWWAVPGTNGKRLYNLNGMFSGARELPVLVVESTIEPPMLASIGIPAVSAFAGGGYWDGAWASFFVGRKVYIVEDQDEAGRKYAAAKAQTMPWATVVQPPGNDLGEAYQNGEDIKGWYEELKDD